MEKNERLKEIVDVDKILGREDCQMLPKMCRKCFTAYRTCSKNFAILAIKLKKVFDDLFNEVIAAAKRPRLSVSSRQSSQSSTAATYPIPSSIPVFLIGIKISTAV